jgi:hypothetical protein
VIETVSRTKLIILGAGTFAAIIIVAVITSLVTARLHLATTTKQQPSETYKALNDELAACIDYTSRATSSTALDFGKYTEIWRLCENQLYDQLLLNDFVIRRQKFADNAVDERVNLALVVAITLSGVFLAAMQLMMSYQLAKIAKTDLAGSNELAVEQGKLSLKSSVTGLMIMALSLVFFVVYVKWIYQNFDVATQKPDNLHTPLQAPAGKLLSGGALGKAPPPASAPAKPPAATGPTENK